MEWLESFLPEGADVAVERELVEPHRAHEGDMGGLVVPQLLPSHNPQTGQFLNKPNVLTARVLGYTH